MGDYLCLETMLIHIYMYVSSHGDGILLLIEDNTMDHEGREIDGLSVL